MTTAPRINGQPMSVVDGGLEVEVNGTAYRIVGGGREWVLLIRYGSEFVRLATFTTRKGAAGEIAMRTFEISS